MTEDYKTECLKALRYVRDEINRQRDIMAYHGINDIARSLDALAFEIKCAEEDYEPSDRILPQPSPARSNGT